MDDPDQLDSAPQPPDLHPSDDEESTLDRENGRLCKRKLQRQRLIQAMIEQPTLAKAAAAANVSYSTAARIVKTAEFQTELQQERRQLFGHASARLHGAVSLAVTKLMKLMLDPQSPHFVQLRAAEDILKHSESTLVLEELEGRIRSLEKQNRKKD